MTSLVRILPLLGRSADVEALGRRSRGSCTVPFEDKMDERLQPGRRVVYHARKGNLSRGIAEVCKLVQEKVMKCR